MNSLDTAVTVCFNLANIAIAWLAWHFLWRTSCQERFRQKLFEVRDELFQFAHDRNIEFDEPAYVLLRRRINAMIRFSKRIGLTRLTTFICLQWYIRLPTETTSSVAIASAISEVRGKTAKDRMSAFSSEIDNHIYRHLLCISPQIIFAAPLLIALNFWFSDRQERESLKKMANFKAGNKLEIDDAKRVTLRIIEAQAGEAYAAEAYKRKHETQDQPAFVT